MILDSYEDIGECLPPLVDTNQSTMSRPYGVKIMVMIYEDIMEFQSAALVQLKEPCRQCTPSFPIRAYQLRRLAAHISLLLEK